MSRIIIVLLVIIFPIQASAITVMSINTEWFWDNNAPHEGQIAVGPAGNPPTQKEVTLKAYIIAQHILQQDADIVGLVEVENKNVVEHVRQWLNNDWKTVWKEGKDSYTGQDVAILTRLAVDESSISNLSHIPKGQSINCKKTNCEKTHRPSKALSVILRDSGNSYLVVLVHFISKRSSNDDKREAQADAIRKYLVSQTHKTDSIIVFGDMNDTPDSKTLKILQGGQKKNNDQIKLKQPARVSEPNADWSYEHKGVKELIDHILVSDDLAKSRKFYTIDLGPISDHRAVVGVFD